MLKQKVNLNALNFHVPKTKFIQLNSTKASGMYL